MERRLTIAPMMAYTDRHFRYLLRLMAPRALLHTEMITTAALLHGDRERLLAYHPSEHPLAVQLGGSDPEALAKCAALAEQCGYDEVNLNVGCPSPRVSEARFGACLMAAPRLVARIVRRIKQNVALGVTVKTRIGIDNRDSYRELAAFTARLRDAGCDALIVHARKAWLNGISAKQNRELPPLDYQRVYRLKEDFPDLEIIINGGLSTLEDIMRQYRCVDGVMLGRVVCREPYLLSEAHRALFGGDAPTRRETVKKFLAYMRDHVSRGVAPRSMSRHLLGMFARRSGARAWRRCLSEGVRGGDFEFQRVEALLDEIA